MLVSHLTQNKNNFCRFKHKLYFQLIQNKTQVLHCHTCINATARCNRMALEINTEWNKAAQPENKVAIEENTEYVGPKNKALGKHLYKDENLRWNRVQSQKK